MASFLIIMVLTGSFGFSQGHVDVNDVSYLWPPVLTQPQAADLLPLSQAISKTVFSDLMKFAKQEGLEQKSGANHFENWHVIAMRIDPCAPKMAPNKPELENCLQEMRLVAQPFSFGKNTVEYYDFSLHLIFQISEGPPQKAFRFLEVWDELLNLKKQNALAGVVTSGVPLRVHPAFKLPSFRKDLKAVMKKTLEKSELKKITFVGAETAVGPWLFFQGRVVDDRFILEPDPSLQGQAVGHVIPKGPGEGGSLEPRPSNFNWPLEQDFGMGPSIQDLFSVGTLNLDLPAKLMNGKSSQVFRLEDIPAALDNPQLSDRTNTDCFSCHTSMSRALLLEIDSNKSPFQFQTLNKNVTLKNILANESMTNFRVFGWFGSQPVTANRVIFESAQVVEMLEKHFKTQDSDF